MKNAKKILILALALLMIAASLIACSQKGDSDLSYVKEKGKMIIGITYFAPMDYFDEDGTTLIGFDHDLAAAVCEKLGVEAVFQEIDWNSKETELASKAIDCIWNGMTRNADREANMSLTTNYMKNRQVVVIRKEDAEILTSAEALAGKVGVAESGSAGEEAITKGLNMTPVSAQDQATALTEVKAKTSDFCVIDSVMAEYLLKSGGDFSDLCIVEGIKLADDEFYAAAFRKGSDITAEVDKAIKELAEDGTLDKIADKYGLKEVLVK